MFCRPSCKLLHQKLIAQQIHDVSKKVDEFTLMSLAQSVVCAGALRRGTLPALDIFRKPGINVVTVLLLVLFPYKVLKFPQLTSNFTKEASWLEP